MDEKTGRRAASCSPQSAASYVRRSAEAMRARGATGFKRNSIHASEYAALTAWAELKGKLLSFAYVEQFQRVSEGAEHLVYFDRHRSVAVKATHANRFGHSADGERRAATPLEYLRRLGWHNVLFGDDIRIEGIAFDGEQMEVVTSQPWIVTHEGRPRPSQQEIDEYFASKGFAKAVLAVDAPLYFNREIGVIIADAHDQNVLRGESGQLFPIDVVVGRPGPALQRQIDRYSNYPEIDPWPQGIGNKKGLSH